MHMSILQHVCNSQLSINLKCNIKHIDFKSNKDKVSYINYSDFQNQTY